MKTMTIWTERGRLFLCMAAAAILCGCNPPEGTEPNYGDAYGPEESSSSAASSARNSDGSGSGSGSSTAGGSDSGSNSGSEAAANNARSAVAMLNPTRGNNVQGRVRFTATDGGVLVVADVSGLKPGKHGIHIHEHGDCSAPDASSAGGHFNPTGAPHGAPGAEAHHVGDLGNITANQSGQATMDKVFDFLTLSGTHSIVGRAIIVHSQPDDLQSQPSGSAGDRMACGVIELQ